MRIEQAVLDASPRVVARSPGFVPVAPAEAACAAFGARPDGAACPRAMFALPLGRDHVAVVRAVDRSPGTMCFRVLAVPRALYLDLGGDPFRIDEAFEPDWDAAELPALEWTFGLPRMRTVEELERVLKVEDERCAWLLGATQALVDGGRVVYERPGPDEALIRDLWALLPYGSRSELWPATFAFDGARFHAVAVPVGRAATLASHVTEAQAGDYPEGRYELDLQAAVEAGDQRELERLLTRRTRREMVWVAVGLLIAVTLVAAVASRARGPEPTPPAVPGKEAK